MELWTSLFAPCITSILVICFQELWPCLSQKAMYMWEAKKNLVELRRNWNILMGTKDAVLSRVDAGEQRGEQRLTKVSEWLSEVATIEINISRLLPDACDQDIADQGAYSNDNAPVHQRPPTCGCCYKFSSCCLGEEVFKTLNEIRRLSPMGIFDVVTEPAPPTFMIPASKLTISHGKKPENWTWSSIREHEAVTEIATMNEVHYLGITGGCHTPRKLIPETKYAVVFVVRLEESAFGWDKPVDLSLEIDHIDIISQQTTSNLANDVRAGVESWVDVKLGDFVAPPKDAPAAKFTFSMYQKDSSFRKTGLMVKGVAFRACDELIDGKAN